MQSAASALMLERKQCQSHIFAEMQGFVKDGIGSLHPKDTSGNAAKRCSEQLEPFCTVSAVCVQTGGIWRVSYAVKIKRREKLASFLKTGGHTIGSE